MSTTEAAPGALPRISLVTPCLNMAPWLEETLASIHGQGYPDLEHVVVDGGSTDGTLAILERWRPRLKALVVGDDRGLYDAVNKGFAHTTGEVMTYLGADDLLLPGALRTAGSVFASLREVEWITGLHQGRVVGPGHVLVGSNLYGFGPRAFLRGEWLLGGPWPSRSNVQAEGSFWRRGLWERAGGRMSSEHGLAGDFELWARFFRHARVVGVPALLGAFRQRAGQLSATPGEQYLNDCRRVLAEYGGKPPGRFAGAFLASTLGRGWFARALRHLLGVAETTEWVRWDGRSLAWQLVRRSV